MKAEVRFKKHFGEFISVVIEGPSREVLELVGIVRSAMKEAKWEGVSG
jgi:hypothetical protein